MTNMQPPLYIEAGNHLVDVTTIKSVELSILTTSNDGEYFIWNDKEYHKYREIHGYGVTFTPSLPKADIAILEYTPIDYYTKHTITPIVHVHGDTTFDVEFPLIKYSSLDANPSHDKITADLKAYMKNIMDAKQSYVHSSRNLRKELSPY